MFTFLDQPGVPFDNNAGERAIRPAVIIRKNSYG
ncbi:MAG TPA: transposase, partial [Thermoguttaceae bacterium]|nr:transposase [Thermoguttaceae bacterium]